MSAAYDAVAGVLTSAKSSPLYREYLEPVLAPMIQVAAPRIEQFGEAYEATSDALARPMALLHTVFGLLTVLALAAVGLGLLVLIFRFCCGGSMPSDQPSVMARHIVVEHEEEANVIKEHLAKKADSPRLVTAFGDVALKNSTICWSGAVGGALGTIALPTKFGPEWDRAAWSAPLMTVHGPVKTAMGYHLILVIQRSGRLPVDESKKDS